MNTLFLILVVAFVAFILFMQLRTYKASMKMTGRPAPEAARRDPRGVIYYFHHPRCGPCRQMGKVIDQIAAAHPEQVVKVNLADEMALAQDFGVLATPTTLVVKDGRITEVVIGARSARRIEALLD